MRPHLPKVSYSIGLITLFDIKALCRDMVPLINQLFLYMPLSSNS